jgi:RecJ-like exonuclease
MKDEDTTHDLVKLKRSSLEVPLRREWVDCALCEGRGRVPLRGTCDQCGGKGEVIWIFTEDAGNE